jgi:hypothetical protein
LRTSAVGTQGLRGLVLVPVPGPRVSPGICMRVRVSAQMGVMTETPDSPLLRKPHWGWRLEDGGKTVFAMLAREV